MIGGPRPRHWTGAPDAGASHLAIDRRAVLRLLGYRPGRAPLTPAAGQVLADAARHCRPLLQPGAWLAECAVAGSRTGGLALAAGIEWQSATLVQALRRPTCVTLVAATVGAQVDAATDDLFRRGETALAAAVDATATAALWAWMRLVRRHLSALAAGHGLRLTAPYCPGYGDWPVTDMAGILALLGTGGGVAMTGGGGLAPRKSLVAVLGWTSTRARMPVGCGACSLVDCQFRAAPPGRLRRDLDSPSSP